MKILVAVMMFFVSGFCSGENIMLSDGTKITGRVKGSDADSVEVETAYGILKIGKDKIVSIDFFSAPPQPSPAREPDRAEVPASSVPAQSQAETVCKTVVLSSGSVQKVYYAGEAEAASETLDSSGNVISKTGKIPDGTVREYYENGKLKSEKVFKGEKANGPAAAYYPDGKLQSEAVYLDNRFNGAVKIYGETGALLFEQSFKAGVADGLFREYDAAGGVKSELLYSEGHITDSQAAAAPADVKSQAPAVTGISIKTKKLARGIRYTFYNNDRHLGTQVLDPGGNVTGRTGKVPDGIVRTYFSDGKTQTEMSFLKGELNGVSRFYYENGVLASETEYSGDKVVNRKSYDENGRLLQRESLK